MAKKSAAKAVAAVCDRRSPDNNPPRRSQTAAATARPSSLLDTRVIYHFGWHASHYVKVMLNQIFGGNHLYG